MITLSSLNQSAPAQFVTDLSGIFEHSPWVPECVCAARPFANSIVLHRAMCQAVLGAGEDAQLNLIRAHPELAGRAAVLGTLTGVSTREQAGAGLSTCSQEQFNLLQSLNTRYHDRFGFPFVLAVKGHTPDSVITSLQERIAHSAEEEQRVALEQIFRIAWFRMADLIEEPIGELILGMADDLALFSETSDSLTCSYLTPTHRATAHRIRDYMLAMGLCTHIDAVGNVIGVLASTAPEARSLLTGSHYDTVINAGKYDGRLGILLPTAVAGALRRQGVTLPYNLEIIAFAEEEGVRFKATLLGSRAVAGQFDLSVLAREDAAGIAMSTALGPGVDAAAIAAIARDPGMLLGFLEVHIEQGPVLLEGGQAVGVVTAIAGSTRSIVTLEGLSGHAGTVPMASRRDAATAAAEMVLAIEARCSRETGLVGTVGQLGVPNGAVNVIPGRCIFSVDVRSGSDAARTTAMADISLTLSQIAARRGVSIAIQRVLEAPGVPCSPSLMSAVADSILRVTAKPAVHLPSGAGHDAMMMASVAPIAMLFVRCGNGGISHHPAETLTGDDAQIAAMVFEDFLQHFEGIA